MEPLKKVGNAFDGLKRLRVLDLHEAPNMEEIPSSLMDNLKHLRYLDLSCTLIANLPKSLTTRLYHLQTLRLIGCVNLKELPEGIGKLINLRHLWLPDDMNLPREIGQLSSLRTLVPYLNLTRHLWLLPGEDIGAGGGGTSCCGIEDLEGLNLLRDELRINHLRNVTSEIEAQRGNLMGKKNLNKILLSWHKYDSGGRTNDEVINDDDYSKDEAVLEALQPHPNLKMLCIDQYFGVKLPRWMGEDPCRLPNLVFLELSDCPKCEQLVGFGKLPSLKMLQLFNMDGSSSSSYGGVGAETAQSVLFPSLEKLGLSDMGCLEEWVDINYYSCFPCLEEIHIYRCPNLRITPKPRFPSLKKLFLQVINARVVMPLITTNLLGSLETVELVKIIELRFLPQSLLQANKLKVLRVYDCLDFQGFLLSEEARRRRSERRRRIYFF